jgi:hypothetical protein
MKLFDDIVEKIFKEAGVDPVKNLELFEECVVILHRKMATLSVTHGLSYERVRLFDEQKQTLVDDLKIMKKKGRIKT